MRREFSHGLPSVGVILVLTFPLGAQPGSVVPSSGVQPSTIRLSETARLRLALEGPAPLRVELPKEPEKLLSPESAGLWRIRPDGSPTVTALADGRERWELAFRLDWWGREGKQAVAFAPVKVTAGTDLNPREVTWPGVEVTVQTTLAGAKAEDARPVTGIEELPPIVPPDPAVTGWQLAAALAGVFAAVLVVALVRRARAKPPPLPPGEWALRELAADPAADRVAAVLREYVERRHGLPAPKLTTAELATACAGAGWPADQVAPLREVLERCDRAKFAGDLPDAAETRRLAERAREWVGSGERRALHCPP